LNTSQSAVGFYTYRTTINLTNRDPSSVIILGRWATDNAGRDILVNAVSTANPQHGGFTAYTSFAISSKQASFVAGPDTLDFVVENVQAIGYTGSRMEILQSNARILPGTAPVITRQPTPSSVKAAIGDTIILMATAAGSAPLSYQWKKGSTPLPNQTSPTLTL